MFRPDIPFSRDDANKFLPWMVALMAAITALMLLLALTFGQWVAFHRGGFSNMLTVQLPADNKHPASEVITLLQKVPGVKSVSAMNAQEVQALVEPWLGEASTLEGLDLPVVIDVAMESPDAVDLKDLRKKLEAAAPGAALDGHELWVEKFSRFNRAVQAAMIALSACIFAALAGMMVFTARASMKLHASTVGLLHGIGAEDRYIARQFQINALALSFRGALPGVVLAGMLYAALGYYIAKLDAPMLPSLNFGLGHVALLAALPVICGLVAAVSVRYAALGQLRHLP